MVRAILLFVVLGVCASCVTALSCELESNVYLSVSKEAVLKPYVFKRSVPLQLTVYKFTHCRYPQFEELPKALSTWL